MDSRLREPVHTPDRSAPSRARRAAARATDVFTVFFLVWGACALVALLWTNDLFEAVSPEPWGTAFVPTVAFVVALLTYQVVFLVAGDGQTPGRDIWKVRVVTRGDGRLGPARALRREVVPTVVWLLPPPVLALVLASVVGAFGVGDRIGRTRTEAAPERDDDAPGAARGKGRRIARG